MATLTDTQISQYAWNAGFRGSDLTRAVATALAESSGRTDAVSSTGCCHGLMQINTRVHTQYSAADMRDPAKNMAAARALQQRDGWQPWNSSRAGMLLNWTRASYAVRNFLASNPSTIPPQAGAIAGQAASAATGLVPGLSQAVDAANRVTKWVTTPANIGRVVMVVAGSVLVIAAIIRIAPMPTPMAIAKVLK